MTQIPGAGTTLFSALPIVQCAAGYVDSLRNSVALDQFNPQFVPNTQPQSTDGELWLVMAIPNVVFSVQLQHSVTVWQEVKFYYICFFNLTMLNIIAY